MRRGSALSVLLLTALIFTGEILAQTPKAKAKLLLKEASTAFSKGRFEAAAHRYIATFDTLKSGGLKAPPALLYNAGLAFERAGRCARVVALFERYLTLTTSPSAVSKPNVKRADLQKRLASAQRCAPQLVVHTEPSGALISLDGVDLGTAPLKQRVRFGAYTLRARLPGHRDIERSIAIVEGTPLALNLKMENQQRSGRVSIKLDRQVVLYLDGARIAEGPYQGLKTVSAGVHELRFEEPGCPQRTLRIEVSQEAPFPVEAPRPCVKLSSGGERPRVKKTRKTSGWVWASLGTGLIAAAAGGTMSGLYLSTASQRDRELTRPSSERDGALVVRLNDRGFGYSIGSGVGYGLGAIGLGVALILWLVERSDAPQALGVLW